MLTTTQPFAGRQPELKVEQPLGCPRDESFHDRHVPRPVAAVRMKQAEMHRVLEGWVQMWRPASVGKGEDVRLQDVHSWGAPIVKLHLNAVDPRHRAGLQIE